MHCYRYCLLIFWFDRFVGSAVWSWFGCQSWGGCLETVIVSNNTIIAVLCLTITQQYPQQLHIISLTIHNNYMFISQHNFATISTLTMHIHILYHKQIPNKLHVNLSQQPTQHGKCATTNASQQYLANTHRSEFIMLIPLAGNTTGTAQLQQRKYNVTVVR
jgi:hypothetical protein